MMLQPGPSIRMLMLLSLAVAISSCNTFTWSGTHGDVRYSIHRDLRQHAIVKGKNGSLMYDSPELVVLCENGQLMVNGEAAGQVSAGDLVEITEIGTVLVNGQRRGDKLTGHAKMHERIEQAKIHMQTHSNAELKYLESSR